MTDTVQQLIQRRRYHDALEQLLEQFEQRVFRMAMLMLKDRGRAEEVTQDVFVKVWRALPIYDGRASVQTWLYTIARNTCRGPRARCAGRDRQESPASRATIAWRNAEMTTACDTIRMVILEALADPAGDATRHDVDVHVRECPSCEEFSRRHRDLDHRLSVALRPPSPSHQLRLHVRRQIRLDARDEWNERLPDIVHFAGCGVATAIGALLLPFDASATIVVGFVGALLTYALLVMTRSWLEDV